MKLLRRVAAAAISCAVVLVLAGCSTPSTEPEPLAATPVTTVPPAPETSLPSTRSGPLQQSDLPKPQDLGDGWEYRIDPGSVEDGYSGSGAPAIAREPRDVVAAITPLGCQPRQLPTPHNALEVTYKRFETPAVGLLLAFANDSEARDFFAEHTAVLRDCTTSKQIELNVEVDEPQLFISERTERSGGALTWTEGISLNDSQVLLIAVGAAAESEMVKTLLET